MFRHTSHQRHYHKLRGKIAAKTTQCAGARSSDSRALGLPLPHYSQKARGVGSTRLRNDGTLGEGRKTYSLHCERTAPSRKASARAHTYDSHTRTLGR